MLGPVDLADWVEIQDGIDGAPERKARAQALWGSIRPPEDGDPPADGGEGRMNRGSLSIDMRMRYEDVFRLVDGLDATDAARCVVKSLIVLAWDAGYTSGLAATEQSMTADDVPPVSS